MGQEFDHPRFEIRGELGEGSSAQVYRAWDRELRREVALKVLRDAGGITDVARERFRREAQAAAKVAHPNAVGVHDAGEHAGRLFLVMELVEGKSLQDLLASARPDRGAALELLEKSARAVAAAHARGIVHRDLKPGNILIAPTGEPKVADFGLAHLPDASRALTRTGALLGTPLYMAPEQVEGKEATARTDVYALGAILYELLAGRPPHAADRVPELYRRILGDDPVPPRRLRPDLPADLETVVMKALERDPARRYADAGAFAEDLRRFREGRPVEARPGSRWAKALRRRRAAAGAGVAVLAVLAALGASWSVARAREEEALGSLRQTARLSVDAALRLRRAGDAGGMRQFLPPLEEAYRKAVRLAPDAAETDYLLGRMHRALQDDARALEHQARAIGKDPDYAPAIYERVVLNARSYDALFRAATESLRSQAIHMLTSQGGRPSRVPSREEVELWRPETRELRESIIADCGRLKRLARGPWMGDAHALAAEGILAFCERRYEEGRARLEEALDLEPQLEEAWEARARVLEGEETEAGSAGEKEALRREAERVYEEAIFFDQAYLPFHLGRGNTFMRDSVARFRSGRDPLAALAAAEKDFEECVRIDPGHAEARQRLGAARIDRGRYLFSRGRDPAQAWEAAGRDLDRAIELRKDALMSWSKRGFLEALRGLHESSRGGDPGPGWERAERDLSEALRLRTAHTDPWLRLGMMRTWRGLHERESGRDPLPSWREAELNLTEVLRMAPGYSEALTRRGLLRHHRALHRAASGGDPIADWEAAEADLTAALESEDLYAECRALRGILRAERGHHRLRSGGDPDPDWERAEEDFRRAAEGTELALAQQGWGDLAWRRAERTGSRADFADAARRYAEAVRLNPRLEPALAERRKEAGRRAGAG